MTTLETERLRLTPITQADAYFFLELVNDPGWVRSIGQRDIHTVEAAAAYVAGRYEGKPQFVVRNADGEPLGLCGLVEREGLEHPDIGYAFLERHSGKGYATEAARAVLAYGLGEMGLPVVLALTSPDNAASQRVLEKIGLRFVQMVDVPGWKGPSAYFTTAQAPSSLAALGAK